MINKIFIEKHQEYIYDKNFDLRISSSNKELDEKTLNDLINSTLLSEGYKTRDNLIVECRQCIDVTREKTIRIIMRVREIKNEKVE